MISNSSVKLGVLTRLFVVCAAFVLSFSNVALAKGQDDFKPMNSTEVSSSDTSGGDEFKPIDGGDEFKEVSQEELAGCAQTCSEPCEAALEAQAAEEKRATKLHWILWILGFTALAGVLVRFKATRNLRGIFLIASFLTLGYFTSPCTGCPINGIQGFFLGIFGYVDDWYNMLWFMAIIPITYLFGKVWCGWICHLGALQEFIHLPGKINLFRSAKAQRIAYFSRIILLIALIIQLAVMGTKYWCSIDPFIQVFTFGDFMNYLLTLETFDLELIIIITLILLLLVSSVLSYRPFCRFACPVGLILGWVAYIPGASVLGIKGKCAGCKMCNNACQIDAILKKDKHSVLNNQECIMCGDCMTACPNGGLSTVRKLGKHTVKVDCTNDCKL